MIDVLPQQLAAMTQGDHICLIYNTMAEQVAATVPFLKDGLARRERCLYIVDDRTAEEVVQVLVAAGVDVDQETDRGAFALLTKREAYLASGEFSPEAMIGLLREVEAEALAAGFSGLRVTGEMTWALGPETGCDRVMEYEALLNQFFPGSQSLAICQYNRQRFTAAAIEQVLQTHPIAILGEQVCRNLYYEPPEVFFSGTAAAHRVEWKIAQLVRANAADRQLKESEDRFRATFEQAAVGVAEVATDGRWLRVNQRLCNVLGYTADDLLSCTSQDITHAEDVAADLEYVDRLLAGDLQTYSREKRYVRTDGTPVWVNLTASLVRQPAGRSSYCIAIIEDITARKQAETERDRLLHLEREARAEAEAANRAKTQFLTTMSHELRTPLNAIAGYTELLEMGLRGPVTPQQCEDLKRIRKSQRHLLSLINDVLNFARIEAGQVTFAVAVVSISEILAGVEALVGPQLRAKGLHYEPLACDSALAVHADPEKLRQILLNLLSNAIKFTRRGGWVTMQCDATAGRVTIRVRDTGHGIPADKLRTIFEPFVQLDRGLTTAHEGVGLGLAISRELAYGMGGELTAESTLGHGSTFILALPRACMSAS